MFDFGGKREGIIKIIFYIDFCEKNLTVSV